MIALEASDEGAIPVFGTRVLLLPGSFWISFLEKILKTTPEAEIEGQERKLEDAFAEYGYHDGHAIISSAEFRSALGPLIEKEPEDTLHGLFALLAAWGWADAEIAYLDPGEKMVVHARGYLEAEIHDTFPTCRPAAFMLAGFCRAAMDLAYGKAYPDGFLSFQCSQTRAIERGDQYGEFVATKALR